MIVYEEKNNDVLRLYTKSDNEGWKQVAVFPDDSRSEEASLWDNDRTIIEIVNNFVEIQPDGKNRYSTAILTHNRQQLHMHAVLSLELLVSPDGTVNFDKKWARIAPNDPELEFVNFAASANVLIKIQSEG